ncbi:MAG: hypothetical protein AAF363_07985 [Bacteroidota bacterium]
MRLESFFNILKDKLKLDLNKTNYFLTNPNFLGGWEVWLQCNIGYAFSLYDAVTQLQREICYPSGNAANPYLNFKKNANPQVTLVSNQNSASRCDFLIKKPDIGVSDDTYIELKCQNSNRTVQEAWNRFAEDIVKVEELTKANNTLNCISLLCTYEQFDQNQMARLIDLFDSGTRSSFVLDFESHNPVLTRLKNVKTGGMPRTMIIGCALNRIR